MKWALVDGQRQEAQSGRSGVCPGCKSPMVARCGDVRVHHWAHRGGRHCDTWWENETEWHRNWKDKFPVNWQEVVHPAENGECHIADVKTDQGWVLEFQHSKIHPDERKAREAFYQKLVWIVDGARRKRDKPQFFNALQPIAEASSLFRIIPECALLRDWTGSIAPILFDFSESDKAEDTQLWCLFGVIKGIAYVGQLSRDDFIKFHSSEGKGDNQDFSGFWRGINSEIEGIIYREEFYKSRQVFDPLAALLRHGERPRRMRRL
jgi:hypothetical protein